MMALSFSAFVALLPVASKSGLEPRHSMIPESWLLVSFSSGAAYTRSAWRGAKQ